MDLSKAEKTLSKLEENSEKVAEVTKSVQKFEKISEKLQNLPDDIKKNTSLIELRIVDVEKQINKENEKLTTLFKDEIKSSTDTNKKNLDEIKTHLEQDYDQLKTEIKRNNEYLKDELEELNQKLKNIEKSMDVENLKINRNIYVSIFLALIAITLLIYQSGLI